MISLSELERTSRNQLTIAKPLCFLHDDALSRYLEKYSNFLDMFTNYNVMLAITTKSNIVYYEGKYKLESAHKYKNTLYKSKYHIDDFTYLNKNAFVIRMDNMEIKNAINNFDTKNEYQIPLDQLNEYIIKLEENVPKKYRNLFVINNDVYKIAVLFRTKWHFF